MGNHSERQAWNHGKSGPLLWPSIALHEMSLKEPLQCSADWSDVM